MAVLKTAMVAILLATTTGCQISYYVKSAYNHLSMISNRVPISEALKDPQLPPEARSRLQAAAEAHEFAVSHIGLKPTDNYTTFIQLDRPYVSWVVSAAPRWKLEHHQWSYPFVGKMPYKGFASEEDAREEQAALEKRELDTYLRGVSAYSTLGWFQDSVLSSMLRQSEHGLVNTVIHETVHTTLYIRNSADFNERLAVFVGNKGTEEFYRAKEGENSATLRRIADENHDDALFSRFIGPELAELKTWYEILPEDERREELRKERFAALQKKFATNILPRMKTTAYKRFPELPLNNARLLYYRTYLQDLRDFEELFESAGNWRRFLACAKTLEKDEKPEEALRTLNRRLAESKNQALSLCPDVSL